MHAPALALASEFWWRHRWGLAGVAAIVVGFAAACAAGPFTAKSTYVHSIWFMMALAYVIGLFAYGFEGRLETAESGFPPRLFALPVRTVVLVGGPMLQGVATAVVLWLMWDRFVLRPSGVETPGWWTLMLAAVVAVSQALVWLPFGLPWVRLAVAVPVLAVLVKAEEVAALAGYLPANPDAAFGGLAAALVAASFLAAWGGVGLARRGDAPDWLWLFRPLTRVRVRWREKPPFATAVRAQVWYEWRLRGTGYLVTVAAAVTLFLSLGIALDSPTDPGYALAVLVMPVMLSGVWGAYMGMAGDSTKQAFGLTAFAATRPLSNGRVVAAKLRAAAEVAVVAWVGAVVVAVVLLACTNGLAGVPRAWDAAAARLGMVKAAVLVGLVAVGPVFVIWRMLVANLCVGLTGRAWVPHAYMVAVGVVFVPALEFLQRWHADRERYARLGDLVLGGLAVAGVVKLVAAARALRALRRRGEVGDRTLGRIVAVWVVATAALAGLLVWLVPAGPVPVPGLIFGAVLFAPAARLAAAPLALAWNRHR